MIKKTRPKVLVSWSTGKDSAWMLHRLRQTGEVEIAGLLTAVHANGEQAQVAVHAVPDALLQAQADAAGLPLWRMPIPHPCSNEDYRAALHAVLRNAQHEGISQLACGDLFLEDIRQYRESLLAGTGIEPIFPLWQLPTRELANSMIAAGLRARLTCVDGQQISQAFVGREFDASLLDALPVAADPCGENGEFHTFVFAGPMFTSLIEHSLIEHSVASLERGERFAYAHLQATVTPANRGPSTSTTNREKQYVR